MSAEDHFDVGGEQADIDFEKREFFENNKSMRRKKMATKSETLAKEKARNEEPENESLVDEIADEKPAGKTAREAIVLDVENDLRINKFKLDLECVSHSSHYFRYAEAAQQAKVRVSELEDKLKLVTAEQNINIRNEFINNGVKFTESVIDAELTKDEKVKAMRERVREAQREAGTLAVAVSAFEHRKSELDNLVRLYIAGYWSQPAGNRETGNDRAQTEIRRGLGKEGLGKSKPTETDDDDE